jgi:peptidoglycan lytic transglycosylase D
MAGRRAPPSPKPVPEPEPPLGPGKSRRSMELVRKLYERMSLMTRIYRTTAALLLLAAAALAARLLYVSHRDTQSRLAAAEVFYQLKELELDVSRLRANAPERRDIERRRAGLETMYDEWLQRLGETSRGERDEQAIRAAVARLGEARVLVSDRFIRDVRRRAAEWRRTADFARALRAAADSGYPARIESVLVASHLPADLVWVAYQESRFQPRAVGPPTRYGVAKGMWQMMPVTARAYGLRTGPLVGQARFDPADQRHQFTPATTAAVRYLGDLYLLDAQGSGLLVMACYNAGQTRVLRLLRSLPATPRDRNFWRLVERFGDDIPDETYGYVVGIVAASAVAADPTAFGFSSLPRIRS